MYVAGAENGISPGAPARRSGEVTVRFINTPAGEDVTTTAELGEVLMQVGDRVGIAVPRGCRTGLCGACTCDIQDPTWKAAAALSAPGAPKRAGDLGPRDGWQTVRACSAEVALPAGCDELVVDVFRMAAAQKRRKAGAVGEEVEADAPSNAFASFDGDWEKDYVPAYKQKPTGQRAAFVPDDDLIRGVAPWDKVW